MDLEWETCDNSWESTNDFQENFNDSCKTSFIYDIDKLVEFIYKEIESVSEILDISINDSFKMLIKHNFKINYNSEDIYNDLQNESLQTGREQKQHSCSVPFCEPESQIIMLDCGHSFCFDCLSGYLDAKVQDGPTCLETKCIDQKCAHTVGFTFFTQCLSKEYYNIFIKIILNKLSDARKNIFWHDCGTLIVDSKQDQIKCKCGDSVCIKCKSSDHYPCPCDLYRKWKDFEKSTDATEIWLKTCTKECPKCKTRIQKNAGCSHMACKNCNTHFCWICLQDWSVHGYTTSNCVETDDSVKLNNEIKQNNKILNKYHYYYLLFKNSELTVKRIKELIPKLEIHCKDDKFIFEAISTHNTSRQVYQYLQIVLCYLKDCREKTFLDFKIGLFYQQLEELSKIILNFNLSDNVFLISSQQRIQILTLERQIRVYQKELGSSIELMDDLIMSIANESCDKWGCTTCDTIYNITEKICKKCKICQLHRELQCIECGQSHWSRHAQNR